MLHDTAYGLVTLRVSCTDRPRASVGHSNPLRAQDRITHTSDFRIDRPRHQVYIDDVNFFAPLSQRDELERLQRAYIAAAERAGLPVKWSKVVLPSADGVECLGLEVRGSDRTVGLSAAKLGKLCVWIHSCWCSSPGALVCSWP